MVMNFLMKLDGYLGMQVGGPMVLMLLQGGGLVIGLRLAIFSLKIMGNGLKNFISTVYKLINYPIPLIIFRTSPQLLISNR